MKLSYSRNSNLYENQEKLLNIIEHIVAALWGIIIAIVILTAGRYIDGARSLEILQAVFTLVAATSVLIAVANFFYQRTHDSLTAVIEQISFFRDCIIKKEDEYISFLWKEYRLKPVRIPFERADIEEIYSKYPARCVEQRRLSLLAYKEGQLSKVELEMLNYAEEFAIKVLHYNTNHYDPMGSVKNLYIEFVESHIIILLRMREVVHGTPTYSHVLRLYFIWKEEVPKDEPSQRFAGSWKELESAAREKKK